MQKKFCATGYFHRGTAAKLLLMMNCTAFLMLIFCLQLHAGGYAQKVTLSERNVSLNKVFRDIKRQTGYSFFYEEYWLHKAGNVTIQVKDASLEETLTLCFANQPLTFSIVGNTVVVKPKEVRNPVQAPQHPDQVDITGIIADESGKPLSGISVSVKGTKRGTSTDAQGAFSIKADPGETLEFSGVGYRPVTMKIGSAAALTIKMITAPSDLSDVVVVGYGVQKKVDLTGAVVTASGAELNKRVVTNPASLLQGKLPGLQVIQNSGEPGNESISLQVRGQGTYSGAGNTPLVIVNGLPGSLSNLDPNNIESVTVLKDAASAAIYGSRAANGVILVTTRNGKEGRTALDYGYNIGITKPTALPKLITNSVEFMELFNEARKNSGLADLYPQSIIDEYRSATDKRLYPNTDWQDIMFNTASVHNHYLNFSGGKNGTNYSVALGIVDQPGTMKGIEFKKYNLQVDLTSTLSKNVRFGTNITMNYGQRTYPVLGSVDQYLSTLAQAPTYGPVLPDGSGHYTLKAYAFELNNKNPVAQANETRARQNSYYLQSNVFLNVTLLPGLQWETRGGINFTFDKTKAFTPTIPTYFWHTGDLYPASITTNSLNVGDNLSVYPMAYSQLTYNKTIGSHHLGMLGGLQKEYFRNEALSGNRLGFPNNDVREISAGAANGQSTAGTSYEWSLSSYYGRLNYSYADKYLFEANARYDGSSRFADGNRWGLFPSLSLGWRFARENFIGAAIPWLNDGKIRASWGRLGNQNIGGAYPYPFQDILSLSGYPFDGNTVTPGVVQTRLVDKDITWETTEITNLGIDLTLLGKRLNVSADWFYKNTFDILRSAQIPAYVGLTAPTVNSGKMRNTGFELQAQFSDHIGEVGYSIGGNIQAYTNKLTGFGKKEIGARNILEEGRPYNTFYLYEWIGIFQSQDEIDKSATQAVPPHPGDLKFRDLDGNGIINDNDRTYVKGAFPSYSYSFSLSANWKSFDLTAFFFGSEGQKTYATDWGIEPFAQGSVPSVDWRNRWTPDNHTNKMPNVYVWGSYPAVNNYASTYFLHDASFIRLKNLQVGYNLPINLAKKVWMQSLRLYFSGDNLWTHSTYPGLDPERVSNSGRYVVYPQNKIFSFGVKARF